MRRDVLDKNTLIKSRHNFTIERLTHSQVYAIPIINFEFIITRPKSESIISYSIRDTSVHVLVAEPSNNYRENL